jgi:hypothetical protein
MIGRLLGIGPVLATAAGAVSAQSLTQAFVEAYRTNPQISAVRDLNRATSPTTSGGVVASNATVSMASITGDDDARLRRRGDLFADPAGAADGRVTAQPAR